MRMTVEQVANLLETTVLVVRYGIQTNTLPGSYIRGPGKRKGSYIITSTQLADHLKISEEEVLERMNVNAETDLVQR